MTLEVRIQFGHEIRFRDATNVRNVFVTISYRVISVKPSHFKVHSSVTSGRRLWRGEFGPDAS